MGGHTGFTIPANKLMDIFSVYTPKGWKQLFLWISTYEEVWWWRI